MGFPLLGVGAWRRNGENIRLMESPATRKVLACLLLLTQVPAIINLRNMFR